MSNTTAMEQITKYYWGTMLSARAADATTATSLGSRPPPPPAHGSGGEPSLEELAFARDATGHLGGCVWPPRFHTCNFCRREFGSAQALGGHMNVHRRDRARLRQCASPDHDVLQQDVLQQQPIAPPIHHHHHQDQHQEAPLFIRAKAVLISNPESTCDHQNYNSKEEAAATARRKEALESDDEEEAMAERRKRRRVDQPPEAVLPFFLRLPAPSYERVDEHDAKVPKVITSHTSSSSLHLAGWQEVDLELRLGSPKVA